MTNHKVAHKRYKFGKNCPKVYAPAGRLYAKILLQFLDLGPHTPPLNWWGVRFGVNESTFDRLFHAKSHPITPPVQHVAPVEQKNSKSPRVTEILAICAACDAASNNTLHMITVNDISGDRHFGPKTLWHQDSSALAPNCL